MKATSLIIFLAASIQAQPFHPSSNTYSVDSGFENYQQESLARRSPQKPLSPSELRAQYLSGGGDSMNSGSVSQAGSGMGSSAPSGSSPANAGLRSSIPEDSGVVVNGPRDLASIPSSVAFAAVNLVKNIFFTRKN